VGGDQMVGQKTHCFVWTKTKRRRTVFTGDALHKQTMPSQDVCLSIYLTHTSDTSILSKGLNIKTCHQTFFAVG